MIGLLILVIIVAVLIYLAATYLPPPINWILVLVMLLGTVLLLFGSADGSTFHCC